MNDYRLASDLELFQTVILRGEFDHDSVLFIIVYEFSTYYLDSQFSMIRLPIMTSVTGQSCCMEK